MKSSGRSLRSLFYALALAAVAACAAPQDSGARLAAASIDESKLVVLAGNTHPKANPTNDVGAVADDFVLDHMQLVLQRSPEQEAALAAHIDQLHDPQSPLFHQWLTASDFAAAYGVSDSDIAVVSDWLGSHGFHVDGVPESHMYLEFSGTARQVREAFHTEIHQLTVRGETHIANMSDPAIPEALAPVVVGIHALHDFMPHPLNKPRGLVKRDSSGTWSAAEGQPDFTVVDGASTFFAVAPADFATIYNLNPLFAKGIRGAGQTVVVIEDTNIKNASDVSAFRSAFGLSGYAGTFSQVHPTGATKCTNPGVNGAEGEAALDAEWAGAAAPDAAIELASCADTKTVFGGLIAVQNLVNGKNPPPIISISYGECEADNGSAANKSYVTAYQQAVAEGVSVFVSSGDEGAASCDADEAVATHGIAVSGFASTPYNVAVGGTDFADAYNNGQGGPSLDTYWNASNTATFASAKSYIPEIPWNDSCASELIYTTEGFTSATGSAGFCNSAAGADFLTTSSASGGPSSFSKQPSFQTGVVGLPTAKGGPRYLPDVSLFAANGVWGHFYVYCLTDAAEGGAPACTYTNTTDVLDVAAGGTSFASPALAGIQALVNQKTGEKQGNPNAKYYKLAADQYGGNCNSTCDAGATCDLECDGGDCDTTCEDGATCSPET